MFQVELIQILKKAEKGEPLSKEEYNRILDLYKPKSIKEFLSTISIEDIESRRERLNRTNYSKLSDNDLNKIISDSLSFDFHGCRMSFLSPNFFTLKKGTIFYRVRRVQRNDSFFPINTLKDEQDAWNPPHSAIIKEGRLNRIGESLLYTSPFTPEVALEEMHIEKGERFCLMVYEAITDIKVVTIGMWNNRTDLSLEENLKTRMIMNILGDLFSRDVGKGTEYLYRVSERIAKDYFDLPNNMQDAWCYPSVAMKDNVNVCFRPDVARKVLKLKGIKIGICIGANNGFNIQIPLVAKWNNIDSKYDYFLSGSKEGRQMFL